jgi:hypothetical protein
MLRSFGKASSSSRDTRNGALSGRTVKEADVEVEVSLDVFDKLYSIVVTENASLQSVVSVPTEETRNRRRKSKMTVGTAPSTSMNSQHVASSRLADSLRPLSPLPQSRHNNPNQRYSRGRERDSNSCPPTMNRYSSDKSDLHVCSPDQTPQQERSRERSCPPIQCRRTDISNYSVRAPPQNTVPRTGAAFATVPIASNKKSKDFVSKAASRNQRAIFGSFRKTVTKVQPLVL